ncbi:MAG: hypothetical protein IJ217_00070 [Clostridia bacterium]|nr:hypothetical protein [Clostridia bacterium]
MLNSIDDIINLHMSEGKIEDAYEKIHFDNKTFILNKYSLRVRRGNMSKDEARRWNLRIFNEVKKDRNLYKEVREFNSVFQLFNRLGIKSGSIRKSESPDFIVYNNGREIGIEITKIYVGNDWVAEKIAEEIKAIKQRKKGEELFYDEYVKFRSRVVTFQIREGIVIAQSGTDKISLEEYIIEIKNKIFEKIRKLMDDYTKCESNIIFVEIASPLYFTSDTEIQKLNEEMKYYISHLDGFSDNRGYRLVLKTSTNWTSFDLKDGSYEII